MYNIVHMYYLDATLTQPYKMCCSYLVTGKLRLKTSSLPTEFIEEVRFEQDGEVLICILVFYIVCNIRCHWLSDGEM